LHVKKILASKISSEIGDLINELILDGISYELYDVKGNWSELDSVQDIQHFRFGTKAETLQTLENLVTNSKVLNQVTFTVKDYSEKKKFIMHRISNELSCDFLVVRSSALNEDSFLSSMAGKYKSVLKIPSDNAEEIQKSIAHIIDSYKIDNQSQNDFDQVLVQPFLIDVRMSGVVFTKDLQTNSPYYTVNYDISNNTESVTSGCGVKLRTFMCYRKYTTEINDDDMKKVITAVQEIESLTNYDSIDIEFAIVKNELYILQVRPIAAHKKSLKVSENDIDKEIKYIKRYILKRAENKHLNLLGNKQAYGVMPDWNPAEIIGINPSPLSFSLYKYLITDNVWAKSRNQVGYKNVLYVPGIVSFAGKPYVDIKMSFNTFIPDTLSNSVSEKLIDFYLDNLYRTPHNHDKVEFYIAITAYDFNFNEKIDALAKYGFTKGEMDSIVESYKTLTECIVNQKSMSIDGELDKIKKLSAKRDMVVSSSLSIPEKIYILLEDCKKYGTLPFSNLARFAFVGTILLKSLLSKKYVLSQKEYNYFLKSIRTVAKDFVEDMFLLKMGVLNENIFVSRYGHLRPGTYDVTSLNYKENFSNYIDLNQTIKIEHIEPFVFSKATLEKIDVEISKHKLNISATSLVFFIKSAIEAREFAKFEFTKNINLVLELVVKFTSKYNFSREDSSFLSIKDILKYTGNTSSLFIEQELNHIIRDNNYSHKITSAIHLPELIFSEHDVDMFFYPTMKPNFITHKEVFSGIVELKNNKVDLAGKIVLIENADPGFDWIFSRNIAGLITKYGGAASHMAIRCAEFDIPAAIGCGDLIYNNLLKYSIVRLNCLNKQVEGSLH